MQITVMHVAIMKLRN